MALDFKTIISKENLFLPDLVEQVLNKYRPASGNCLTTAERAYLFTDLTALLGENLVERALRLLDEWSIIVYQTSDRLRKIVELCSKRNSALVVRILPGINYCKCRYFQRFVLQLPAHDQQPSPKRDCIPFTCEHVLAEQLHQLLIQNPREQILSPEQFKYFYEDFYVD